MARLLKSLSFWPSFVLQKEVVSNDIEVMFSDGYFIFKIKIADLKFLKPSH